MNDIFRTDVFVRYTPETIAAACIHLAARSLKVPLPNNPSWFYVFHISEDDIQAVCLTLLRLYARPKPNYEKLGHEVEKAKKAVLDAKNKAKAKGLATELGTPNSSSRPGTPKNVSPNPSLVLGRRIKGEEDRMSEMGSEKNHVSKKRGRSIESDASKSGRSRSRSKSRSRSSRSHSFTPPSKKRHKSPFRKYRKDRYSPDKYASSKDKHSRKKKHHSRSISRSPDRYLAKASKKYYKDKDYDRHPYSPERHRSRKHRNGHRNSPRDRYGRR